MSNNSSSKPRDIILAHSSDIHIDDGYTARANEGDGTKPLLDVLKTAENVKADVVLLAGDIFEHNRLDNKIIEKTANVIATFSMAVVVLPGTSAPNASGNRSNESRWRIIKNANTARPIPLTITIARRPPRRRSMRGPMRGPTIANGAIVKMRYRATFGRAASGSRLKNNDPASAIVNSASPAAETS